MKKVKKKAQRKPKLAVRRAWAIIETVFWRPRGICAAIEQLREARVISNKTAEAMHDAVDRHRHKLRRFSSYLWQCSPDGDCERAQFAEDQRRNRKR